MSDDKNSPIIDAQLEQLKKHLLEDKNSPITDAQLEQLKKYFLENEEAAKKAGKASDKSLTSFIKGVLEKLIAQGIIEFIKDNSLIEELLIYIKEFLKKFFKDD